MTLAEVWAAICETLAEGEAWAFGREVSWRISGQDIEVEAFGYELRWWRKGNGWSGDVAAPERAWLLQGTYSGPPRQLYLCWNPWEGG